MSNFYRGTYCRRVKKTKDEIRRQLEVDKAAFLANGGKPRSFYERQAAPDAFRRETDRGHKKWSPKYKNQANVKKSAYRAAKKARKKLKRAEEALNRIAPAPEQRNGFHVNSARSAYVKKARAPFVPMSEMLKRYAAKLNGNVPASEKWFLALYKEHGLLHANDKFNEPFADVCIPDIVNHEMRYIIEVQDPTHKQTDRILRDAKKNVLFAKSGYRAFYVWAWDHNSFDAFLPVFKDFLSSKRSPKQIIEDLGPF